MRPILVSGLIAAGVMVAVIAPTNVKAEPQVLTVSALDVVTAGKQRVGGWLGNINQSNRARIRQNVTASASCLSKCSVTASASAVAVIEQDNSVD
jgi:hypothetical protein